MPGMFELLIDLARRPAFDEAEYLVEREQDSPRIPQGLKNDVYMIWHHHCGMDESRDLVLAHDLRVRQIARRGWKDPAAEVTKVER